ncbi:hypothetical protein CCP3SC1_800006 [Gammaproteobacteria bacterium]
MRLRCPAELGRGFPIRSIMSRFANVLDKETQYTSIV